ncbi:phage integrase N-terminal SAM-like domain-containing protein [bacterium]|nr:phage integrase N-terminal SAM-like domain-containing protein [bacterium]
MKPIPEKIKTPYVTFLNKQNILANEIPYYLKWLKYYLDFCEKYSHQGSSHNSLPLFKNKLKQKKQSGQQIEQANKAITLFYQLIESYKIKKTTAIVSDKRNIQKPKTESIKKPDITKKQSWKKELELLDNEIRLRQYSRKTLQTYMKWTRIFQTFLKSKSPDLIDSQDAKDFITHLAVHPVR